MADRYWVGGTGTWTDTAHWSSTSGGASGASVPTSTDNVFFDANSGTGTVTCASGSCSDFTATTVGTMSFSGANSVYGSVNIGGSGTFTSWAVTYLATTTGKTINTGGKTVSSAIFNGVGGEWTLSNNFTCSSYILPNAGTFTTNNFNVSCSTFESTGSSVRTINFGSSTVTTTGFSQGFAFTGSNLTINAGTSTLRPQSKFDAGTGYTFYNVTFLATSSSLIVRGANTYNDLTLGSPASDGEMYCSFNANQTINGTFNATGSTGIRRIFLYPEGYITNITITASAVSLTDVDFYKIAGAGAASWTGTRLGNGGKNSGITFDAPKTVYWNLAAGGAITQNAWATSSGGAVATTNFPLGQDTAIIENTGLNSGTTIRIAGGDGAVIPNISFTTRTSTVTFQIGGVVAPGNITLSNSVTMSGTTAVYFTGSTTLTSSGRTWTPTFYVTGDLTTSGTFTCSASTSNVYSGGTFTLGANATFNSSTVVFNNFGTVSLNSYTLTSTYVQLSPGSTTNFGTGKIAVSGSNTAIFQGSSTQVVTGTPVVEFTYSGATGTRTIDMSSPTEANSISIKVIAGSDSVTITGGAKDLNFTGFSGTLSNSARTVYGNLTVSTGMTLTAGTSATTFAATSGTKTITTNGKTLDFPITFDGIGGTWQLADDLTIGATRTVALTNGTLDTNSKTVTSGVFLSSNSNARTLTLGSTIWSVASTGTVWNCATATNMTLNAGTSEIILSSTSTTARTFAGGGKTYNKVTIGGATGTSTTTISGSNTFATLASTKVVAHTISITSNTTQTIGTWAINGTAGNVVTLGSTSTTNHTLTKSGGGTVTADYMSISRSTGSPTLTWLATNSTNGGNNVGWYFGSFPKGNTLLFGSNF